jgi:hypothetical protein
MRHCPHVHPAHVPLAALVRAAPPALNLVRTGEDRKLSFKALASILKGLGLRHEAVALAAKN